LEILKVVSSRIADIKDILLQNNKTDIAKEIKKLTAI
jgi:hypothetical protein